MQENVNNPNKSLASDSNYFCKSAALNLLQPLHLEVLLYICGLKFRTLSTSDFFITK
jgi:hypothetical protein